MIELLVALVTVTMPAQDRILVHAPHAVLKLEVARTEAVRERGLMFRTILPAHTGMLFVFDTDAPLAFWMKNTLVPLDMVFVAANGRVRSVAANVPIVPAGVPDAAVPRRFGVAKYVVELPAKEAVRDGIVPGTRLPELANWIGRT
jgi:uncharacterized membrane protein (UPF0127 family)